MIVGFEWLIDAIDCDENALREVETLRGCFARIIADLRLKTIGEGIWHKFDGEGGVTGLVMLTESHLACHTYPEHKTATFNLYCCRERPEWNWTENLKTMLGAKEVIIERLERGSGQSQASIIRTEVAQMRKEITEAKGDIVAAKAEVAQTKARIEQAEWELYQSKNIQNPNHKIVGGEH